MQPKAQIHAYPCQYLDHFDRIPDSIVLLILNKLADVRSLGRCSAVSKRFNALVPLVHDVYVKIDRVVPVDGDADEALNIFSHFLKLMLSTILKPFHNLRNPNVTNKPLFPQVSHHYLAQVLKNFTHVQNLKIELPYGDVSTEAGVLLKWSAEFGSTLQNCVILGGTRIDRKPASLNQETALEDNGSTPESFYTYRGLQLRVVWAIGFLLAASRRHFLLQPIIKDHPTLRSLVLTDADGQGTLRMGVEQLKEFREKPLPPSVSSSRTQVPASEMVVIYAPYLELPEGIDMQGATLLAIKPSSEGSSGSSSSRKEIEAFVSRAFDGPFKVAVKTLLKRRPYPIVMNGF